MISLKKNTNKSRNNQTYKKHEKIYKNNENEDKEDYKRNTTKKNIKLNFFKKNSSNISLKNANMSKNEEIQLKCFLKDIPDFFQKDNCTKNIYFGMNKSFDKFPIIMF